MAFISKGLHEGIDPIQAFPFFWPLLWAEANRSGALYQTI